MKGFLAISILLAGLSVRTFGQTNPPNDCPTITIDGPAGIVRAGDTATYVARVTGGRQWPTIPPNITTRWIVEGAEIVRQTQLSTDVRVTDPCTPVTATVIFDGLPSRCPTQVSEKYEVICDAGPQMLGEVPGPGYIVDKELLKRIKSVLIEQANSQIYVVLPMGLKMPKAISRQLAKTKIDQTRITSVNRYTQAIEFWLVPPGATLRP